MKHIFYFAAMFPICWEMYGVTNAKKVCDYVKRMSGLPKDEKSKDKTYQAYLLMQFFYFAWAMIGLFSSQWFLFLAMFLLAFIPKKIVWLRSVDSLLTLILLMFIVLNAYHFHFNPLTYR